MDDSRCKNALPAQHLTDEGGNIFEYSHLPQLRSYIELQKRICQDKQSQDEDFDNFEDNDFALDWVRKDRFEKFANTLNERIEAIKNKSDIVYFPISRNPEASDTMPPHEFHSQNKVNEYTEFIEAASEKYHIDPDLIKAIIYMETSHGYYDEPIAKLLQTLGLDSKDVANNVHKSILPMNINTKFWGDYFGTREELLNPQFNIDAGTKYLAQLSHFLKSSDVEMIASLYNNLATHRTNDYGKRVAKFYREKPWQFKDDPYTYENNDRCGRILRGFLKAIIQKYQFLLQ